jgi:hypothetical protein
MALKPPLGRSGGAGMWVVVLVFACLGFSILYALTDLSGAHEIQRVLEEYFKISADDLRRSPGGS